MATRPYELLARYAPDGTISGVMVRTITTVNGRDIEDDPVPLAGTTDPAFTQFADAFAAAAAAELAIVKPELDTLKAEIGPVRNENAALKAELDAIKNPPVTLRTITPNAFLSRFTTPERRAIAKTSQTDEIVIDIMADLQTVQSVRLDEQKTKDGLNYLASVGLIATERIPQLLADATAEEM